MSVDKVRNIVLVGHSGNGKTSLLEAMLYRAGTLSRVGRIEDGTTVGDHDIDEKDHGHSLGLSTAVIDWNGYTVNVLDTPGHADYKGDAIMAMAAADLAVFVIDGVGGVQSQDTVLWRQAEQMKLPRMIFVNKLDRARSSFERTLGEIHSHFGAHADPVEYPIGSESSFHGITDLITDEAFLYDSGKATKAPIPEDMVEKEHEEHEHLVEEVVEFDDEVLGNYLEGNEPTAEELERLLHDALDAGSVFPVLCGSATAPIGADHLLDIICKVGPAPGDLGPEIVEADGDAEAIEYDPAGDVVALVFKTRIDDFLGQISFVKVIAGTIKLNDELTNSRTGETERIRQIVSLNGADHRSVPSVSAGQVAAVTKLDGTATGDTLSGGSQVVTVSAPTLPTPVYSMVVKVTQPSNEDRLASTLRKLVTEDPTLATGFDPTTRQTTLSGAGETHIAVAIARLERAGVDVDSEPTSVEYRETLTRKVEVEGKFKKQSGGHGQFGVATVRFEPSHLGDGFEFASEVTGGAIPKNLIPAVGAGVEEAMGRGGKHGFPVVDLRAVCTDGKYHSVDSSEMSFKMAGSLALRAALESVGTVVLEPVSEMFVDVPNAHQGDVLGDLNSRRGQVLGAIPDGANVSIHAYVPTSEVQRYAIDLRSMTGGTGSFEIDHHAYQPVPGAILDRVLAEASKAT
ncbi:MAG: elongation factor G [Actinomycetia bacterium]|nr:elongation factor G [Actinomycetes bacterium]MCP4958072.1 elongation factor G [Actinomycetes bacterium]